MELGGLHHVTAVTGNAAGNVKFYTQVLGMRLVKKTVNQDDVSAYHLFYADEKGNPGTDLTFFDWPNIPHNVPGTGMIAATALRAPSRSALDWWAERFGQLGVTHDPIEDRGGRATLPFEDPEGQELELVFQERGSHGGVPWKEGPVPEEMAIRGLHSVSLLVESLAPTEQVLTEVLSFRRAGSYGLPGVAEQVIVFETAAGGGGAEVHVLERPSLTPGQVGIGGVHHVAFRTPDEDQHKQWRNRVARAGLAVTQVIDRYYFKSIYFREPEGVLFEIATDGPGFASDEPVEHLGEKLALPPFLEPYRGRIERGLKPLPSPAELRKAA